MRVAAFTLLLALAATPSFAADAVCTKFNWPVDRELALLRAPPRQTASGTTLAGAPPLAVTLALSTGATLPAPSDKPTDASKYAGYVTMAAPAVGEYLVSLSGEAWIDVVQDGHTVASSSHSGDPDCPGLRKSVRFALSNKPVTLQVSNGPEDHITLAITPWYAKR